MTGDGETVKIIPSDTQIENLKKELMNCVSDKWTDYQLVKWDGKLILNGIRENLEERFSLIDLNDIQGKKIIDFGCNIGMNCQWAFNNGAIKAVGFDYTAKCIKMAKIVNRHFGNKCEFHTADLCKSIPYNDVFDVGFIFAIHAHLTNQELFTKELKRLVNNVVYFESHMFKTEREMPDWLMDIFSEVKFLGMTEKVRKFYRCVIK